MGDRSRKKDYVEVNKKRKIKLTNELWKIIFKEQTGKWATN